MVNESYPVSCILRIENKETNFQRDIKVDINSDLLEDDNWEFEDIYAGASQTLLQKYLPQMKEPDTNISLLRPIDIAKNDFTEFLEDADVNKAKLDIDAILDSLPADKRARLLQLYK